MESTANPAYAPELPIEPARPQFLKVLCILTWIMCGITFISSVFSILMEKSPEEKMQQIENMREFNPEAADRMEAAMAMQDGSYQVINTVLSLIGVGLSAYGAYMMWRLRRRGFFLYIAGEILPYFGLAFGGYEVMKASGGMTPLGESFALVMMGTMLVFDIIFVILYALNLKHMRS